MQTPERIIIFDTTMRDGRQCPWAWVSQEQHMEYVRLADRVGFDIIEAWFPSSSQWEYNQVKRVADMAWSWEISSVIAWLCQLRQDQVERTIRSLEWARWKWMLHTYFPVDPKLLAASVGGINKDQIIKFVEEYTKMAVSAWLQVQFSPEGYSYVGDNFDFCTDLIRAAVRWWAWYINCPDTKGWASHYQSGDYYVENMRRHKIIIDQEFPWNTVIWSVHNHNDEWNAVENSLWGVVNGVARKIEWTVNGVWERAGNADLLQIIMNLRNHLSSRFDVSHIDVGLFRQIGMFVTENMLPTQPHYPITGANAFRHTSWWHVNALLRDPMVYHPFNPSDVWGEVSLVFWPNSWWNHALDIIHRAGYICDESEKVEIAQFVKDYYPERYKGVSDEEFMEAYFTYRFRVEVSSYEKNGNTYTLNGNIFRQNQVTITWNTLLSALKRYLDQMYWFTNVETRGFSNHEKWEWINAISIAQISVHDNDATFQWMWEDDDIEMASIKAFLDAYKRYYIYRNFTSPNRSTPA